MSSPTDPILVCGTLAYDDIGRIRGPFGHHNVKLANITQRFGGCGGNLAFNLALLGFDHTLFAYAGRDDFAPYAEHLVNAGVSVSQVHRLPGKSAHAYIFTHDDGQQFTAFAPLEIDPGRYADDLSNCLRSGSYGVAVIAPDLAPLMTIAVEICSAAGIPIVLSLGQYAELMAPNSLRKLVESADYLIVNSAENQALTASLGSSYAAQTLCIVTDGANPVRWNSPEGVGRLAVAATVGNDPTGCGDAFTAAFVATRQRGASIEDAVAQGIALAGRCLKCDGAQRHG